MPQLKADIRELFTLRYTNAHNYYQRVALYQHSERIAHGACLSSTPSVGLSVRKVYCSKTADWIRIPFGMVSGVGRGMGVLDGGGDCRGERAVLGVNLGRPIVTNGAFATRSSQITLKACYHYVAPGRK